MSMAAPDRILGLQAIRGIAAFLVLLQHVFWLASYFSSGPSDTINSLLLGASGVFLFFGLSGFLMAGQMNRSPSRFLIDRVRRIYPGLLLAFVVSGCALSWFSYSAWPKISTLLLIPTGEADSVFIPYWTLIYEMQFYILIVILGRFSSRYVNPAMIVWALAILIFHSVPPAMVARASYPSVGEMLFSFYNLYFIVGVVGWRSIKYKCSALELLVALALFLMATLSNVFTKYGGVFYYALILFGVFFAIRGASVWRARDLFSFFFVRLGDVSYGVYLIHITACFFVMLLLKEAMKLQLGYWQGVVAILIGGGGISLIFGHIELRLQDKLKAISNKRLDNANLSILTK